MSTNISSINLCPTAVSAKILFYQSPVAISYFANISTWSLETVTSYATQKIIPRTAFNITFTVISLIFLFAFFTWRCVRCCCRICFVKCLAEEVNPVRTMKGCAMRTAKFLCVGLVGLIIGVGIVGMVLINPAIARESARTTSAAAVYGNQIVAGSLIELDSTIRSVYTISRAMVSAAAGLPPAQYDPVAAAADSMNSSVSSNLNIIAPTIKAVNGTTAALESASLSMTGTAEAVDKTAWPALIGFYSLCIASSLMLIIFMDVQCPGGIASFVPLCLLLAVIAFLVGGVLAATLAAGSDFCPASEGIVYDFVGPQYKQLASFYLRTTIPAASIADTLADVGLVNTTAIQTELTALLNSTTAKLTSLIAQLPSSSSQAIDLTTVDTNLRTAISEIDAAIGFSYPGIGILSAVSYTPVYEQYSAVKRQLCCSLTDEGAMQWAILTTIAMLLMLLAIGASAELAMLDNFPQPNSSCCICSPLTQSKLGEIQAAREGGMAVNPMTPPMQNKIYPEPMLPMWGPPVPPQYMPYPQAAQLLQQQVQMKEMPSEADPDANAGSPKGFGPPKQYQLPSQDELFSREFEIRPIVVPSVYTPSAVYSSRHGKALPEHPMGDKQKYRPSPQQTDTVTDWDEPSGNGWTTQRDSSFQEDRSHRPAATQPGQFSAAHA